MIHADINTYLFSLAFKWHSTVKVTGQPVCLMASTKRAGRVGNRNVMTMRRWLFHWGPRHPKVETTLLSSRWASRSKSLPIIPHFSCLLFEGQTKVVLSHLCSGSRS